ncbi:MAG: glycosyltransferase family 4 protein [Betaproteobacteria bacterium]|nr:glycosyltransferase family 4 protein [Betaproteobacteria bacterium]
MRLAIIRQDYAPEATTELFLEAALEALLERNVAVSLYSRAVTPTRLQLIEQVHCDPFHVGRWWRDAGFARAVCRVIGRARANLVEAHQPLPCCDVYRADAGVYASWFDEELANASAPRRWRLRLSPYWRYLLAAERRMFTSPWLRAVICPSTMVKDEIAARFGLPEAKLPVIPQPVDTAGLSPALRVHRTETLARHGIDPAATVFLFASNDWRRDGARAAIEAVARAPAGAHLLLLGQPPTAGAPDALRRELGAGDRATFVGQPPDPRPYLGAADALILPARYDPRPTVVLDAMASGLPPIVGERSGAAALVRERDCGLVVSPKDGAALAAAMQALQDPERRARLAVNARNAVLPFTAAAMTLQAVLLYRDLLAATVPPRRADPPAPGTQPAAPDDDVPTLQREVPPPAARAPGKGPAEPGDDAGTPG